MSRSLLDTRKGVCFMCGRYGPTEKHHIMQGTANRKLSEQDGLWVYLCPDCHNRPPNGVHYDANAMKKLRQVGQEAYEKKRVAEGLSADEARKEFMQRYGKNYL